MRILQFLSFLVFIGMSSAQAAESPWSSADYVQAKIISSGNDIAVQIRMSKGWHTYWRMPGDAGLPPRFDWTGSNNIAGVDIEWPVPKRFEEFGLHTFGYSDEVTFPARITRKETDEEASLRLKLDVMVCSDICVPQTLELGMELKDEAPSSAQKIIDFARRKLPTQGDIPGLKLDTIVAGPDGVVLSAYSAKGFGAVDAFVIVDNEWALPGKPEIMVDKNESRRALIKIPKPDNIDDMNGFLADKNLNITLTNGFKSIEKTISF